MTYEYLCENGHITKTEESMRETKAERKCDSCDAIAHKQMGSAFILQGSGWFRDEKKGR